MVPETIVTPGSRQVAQILEKRIEAGDYSVGQWLPAERELAEEFGVHRRVIRGAITHLEREGSLICRPRCRPLVAARDFQAAPMPPRERPRYGAGTRLVALIMWHGGFEARQTAQQRIFWGFNRALAQADYHGVFLDLGDEIESEEENAAREATRLQYALDHEFAGVVFYPYAYRRNRSLIQDVARQLPLVLIDRQMPGVETDYVGIDNMMAMQQATQHLLSQGHTRIALVTRSEPINTVQDRIAGYRAAMRRADPPAPDQMITVDSALEWSMFDLIFRLPKSERPTALLCVNDFIALQVAERLMALNVQVPHDVALVGFDDLVQTLPQGVGLSSVAQPFEKIGAAAANLFLERVNQPDLVARHIELHAEMTIRGSSFIGAGPDLAIFGADLVSSAT